ncbi:translationally-controlled tumor protein homolog isoform X1 [Latimeria chalumnae]|uniref:translationally-controlled tumor protein homolog isoform X1 n=1 Tax=Latimeria chalumnae TaxID=7897 RepID=UPI0003C1AAF5|nr:PREDICTED: translationally-controlled tumor protein homolog isoform X2 [Latimeria chalumnae]XP_006009286.1 PREDICTED: translationally-controlled tumor protein homolog isoform X3 [Latimeria chalumnae]XP_006009287.1 PREDICTED: translationally-controlled tumor protein homolog isoform X2 [Latimeria chalumnae]|eukprot:XP_006009285.1 PREDICTED: translationally-controlled tumor protein homolog isoform X2 [Latimeria chalumnae]
MITYKDIISGDEMFSDIYEIRENGCFFEVEGKVVERTISDVIGHQSTENPSSQGGKGQSLRCTKESCIDIVWDNKLQQTFFVEKKYNEYLRGYLKTITKLLEQTKPERVAPFLTCAEHQLKMILQKFKRYKFFTGESKNPKGMVVLLDYREDGVTPYMIFFKDGLEIKK